jgi:uncharacterized protein YoxC
MDIIRRELHTMKTSVENIKEKTKEFVQQQNDEVDGINQKIDGLIKMLPQGRNLVFLLFQNNFSNSISDGA